MASDRQMAANKRNALRSTGPRSNVGKLRSRRNAFRHGLSAETVVSKFERSDDYEKLERDLLRDYGPATTIERALVTRLASLLWRLRRATSIESGLFALTERSGLDRARARLPELYPFYRLLDEQAHSANREDDLAHAYVQLCRNGQPLKRLSRYETALWRQVAQTTLVLQSLQRHSFAQTLSHAR